MWSLTLFATALGLAMDAVAVSIASGLSVARVRPAEAFKMATMFGLFQAIMPLGGYALGVSLADWLTSIDHWIAFVLLTLLGINMIRESRSQAEERLHSPFRLNKLIVMAIATSIDAFAVGASYSLLEVDLLAMTVMIGGVTFFLCLPAVWFGARLGKPFAQRAEVFGGVVLILIGSKILIEHLVMGI
jgi:manganese efflux pump family protein